MPEPLLKRGSHFYDGNKELSSMLLILTRDPIGIVLLLVTPIRNQSEVEPNTNPKTNSIYCNVVETNYLFQSYESTKTVMSENQNMCLYSQIYLISIILKPKIYMHINSPSVAMFSSKTNKILLH